MLLYSTDGHVWALNSEFSPMPTIWNTRILDAAGVSAVPATWDEFLDVCDKVKASGKTPTSWVVGGSHQWHNLIVSQKGGWEALADNQFDAPQILEALKLLKTFVDNKWIPDNEIELTWQQSVALFVAEETAFYLNGGWTIGNEITGAGAAPDLKDNVKFAPYPAFGDKRHDRRAKEDNRDRPGQETRRRSGQGSSRLKVSQVLVQRRRRQTVDLVDPVADGRVG